jgi:hypothetical protein
MLKYHEKIDLAAYDISCIMQEGTTYFSVNDSWWLLLEHKSGNHEIKLKAPPNALDRGLLSEKKYAEAWAKDLKRLAVSALKSSVRKILDDLYVCKYDTEGCSFEHVSYTEVEEHEHDCPYKPTPDPFHINCRKCGDIFSIEKAETHNSLKCGGAANAMGTNTTDEFSDDSEDSEEDSDSDDDEVVEWETFIGFIEKSAAEQQKMADELGLDVEVLRASAQKPAAKEVDKVQLLHQRVVVALHQRLEGLKRRREKLLQSRLKQPLTQDRVAMVDWMRANC